MLECASAELIALGAAVFLLFFLATVVDLRKALSVVNDERSHITAEADAFGAFADEVADLDAVRPRFDGGHRNAGPLVGGGPAPQLERVRDAYRRTVMSVPHYDEEYGEPLAANMAMEFGQDVAGAVATGAELTPQLKNTLLERSRQAREKRLLLAECLGEEAEAVERAADRLDRVSRSVERIEGEPLERYEYRDLTAEWYLLEDRHEECQRVLETRQETVQDRRGLAERVDVVDTLEEYIYEPMAVDHPVLTEGAHLLDRVEDTQHRIADAIAGRT